MSNSLYWRPAPKDLPPAQQLPYELKRPLARRYWDHDGSLHSGEIELTDGDLPYLDGLADGGVPGASDLIAAIREHGTVQLWIAG